ncbi:MAG TPA: hypothetical protein VIJ85_07825 [Rhizomicrobium sp.]
MSHDLLKQLGPYIAPIIVVIILARRLIKNPARKVKTSRMFIMPAIVTAGTAITLYATPMPGLMWIGIYVVAAIAGAVVGFLTAHHQEFALNYETGEITSKSTPIGTILVAALFAVRFGLKLLMPDVAGSPTQIQSYTPNSPVQHFSAHASASLIGWTDAGLIFSTAMLIARAATTWLRAQPLLAEHKAHLESKKSDGI